MIIMNKLMENTLSNIKNQNNLIGVGEILEKVDTKFIEWDGCILIDIQGSLEKEKLGEHFIANPMFPDRTQFEAFHNHIHIIDYFPELENSIESTLLISMEILKSWKNTLMEKFPKRRFLFIISYSMDGSILRFHSFHKGEEPWVDVNRLDDFLEESVYVEIV